MGTKTKSKSKTKANPTHATTTEKNAQVAPAIADTDGRPDAEAIRLHAYRLWEAAGKPEGDGVNFWLDAERELSEGK